MSKRIHFIGGLLRSGSTLTCNILNQNPRFYVSSTSPLVSAVGSVSSAWSSSAEIKGLLIKDRQLTVHRMASSMRAIGDAWYGHLEDAEVVIDKNRAWNYLSPLLEQVWPDAKVVTIVRDLRAIVGSIEKQHARTAILDRAPDLAHRTLWQRVVDHFKPTEPLGAALLGMEDLIRRNPRNWTWVRYEDLCAEPEETLGKIYSALGEEYFDHDFQNVVNVAEDVDELYNLKFPHQGDGPVRTPGGPDEWRPWVPADVEEYVMQFSFYNRAFGYSD